MTRKIGLGIAVFLVAGFAIFLFFRASSSAFSEEAAFKDQDNNRIYAFVFGPDFSPQTIREHAEGLEFTAGRVTAAYYYADFSGVPRDGVTFANSMDQANRVIYESRGFGPWRFVFMRDSEGGARFLDCRQDPESELCRQE